MKSGSRIKTVKTFETIPRTDIAILHIRAFQHLDGATFPQRRPGARPSFGSPTITFGFGGRARRMQVRQGRWLTTIPLAVSRGGQTVVRPAGLVFNRTAAVKGDSGGPVIVDGKIVGVQSLVLDPFGKNLHVATVNVL